MRRLCDATPVYLDVVFYVSMYGTKCIGAVVPMPDSGWCKSGVKALVLPVGKTRNTLIFQQILCYLFTLRALR